MQSRDIRARIQSPPTQPGPIGRGAILAADVRNNARRRVGWDRATMNRDTITQVRISGLRAIQDMTLDLKGLTVLIGDNGTGKSSILEALEILRQAAHPVSFINDIVNKAHGGLASLLRRGSKELKLGVSVEGAGPRLDYDISIGNVGNAPVVLGEHVILRQDLESQPAVWLARDSTESGYFDRRLGRFVPADVSPGDLAAASWSRLPTVQPTLGRLVETLAGLEVHVPFETRPIWQQRELNLSAGPRWPSVVEDTSSLSRYAMNLPNAFQKLQNSGTEAWSRVIDRCRLGLGDDLREFRLSPAGRGNLELEMLLGSNPDKPVPVDELSEGQLSYLAFVALAELNDRRSVLAFDEPELHLHPAMLSRVVGMLEEVAAVVPVILSTHSDRLLDALQDPGASVVLCDLDTDRATQLRRPNPERLAEWMQTYRGFGSIRAEGYEAHVFEPETSDSHPKVAGAES